MHHAFERSCWIISSSNAGLASCFCDAQSPLYVIMSSLFLFPNRSHPSTPASPTSAQAQVALGWEPVERFQKSEQKSPQFRKRPQKTKEEGFGHFGCTGGECVALEVSVLHWRWVCCTGGECVALEVSVLHWRWVFFRIRSKVSWSWRFMADGTELFACDEKHALFFCKTSSGCFCLIYEHCSDSAESKHQQFCDNVC